MLDPLPRSPQPLPDSDEALSRDRRLDVPRIAGFLLCVLAWALLTAPLSLAEDLVNVKCPVRPEEPAEAELSLHYGEYQIGFCCEHCRGLFAHDPEPYLAELPAEVAAAVRAVHDPPPETVELGDHLDLVVLVVLLLSALLAWRRGTPAGRRVATAIVLLGLLAVTAFSWWTAQRVRAELKDAEEQLTRARWKELIHNNTYYDFGDPPRPIRPPAEPRLTATFYRGNDERSDRLFNGGHYLTSLFDLALVDAAGEPLQHGQDVNDVEMALRFTIRRGPHTPDFFWSDDIMGNIFLTAHGDPFLGYEGPVPDRQDVDTVEAFQRWQGTYPLGRIFGSGEETLEKVLYVAEPWFERGRMIGATFHYGIEIRLAFEDGRVDESSEVYMGALFRPRKSPLSRIPNEEWLSHLPIPPLPGPQGEDPETLGIADYREGSAEP